MKPSIDPSMTPAQGGATARLAAAFGPLEFVDRPQAKTGGQPRLYPRAA